MVSRHGPIIELLRLPLDIACMVVTMPCIVAWVLWTNWRVKLQNRSGA